MKSVTLIIFACLASVVAWTQNPKSCISGKGTTNLSKFCKRYRQEILHKTVKLKYPNGINGTISFCNPLISPYNCTVGWNYKVQCTEDIQCWDPPPEYRFDVADPPPPSTPLPQPRRNKTTRCLTQDFRLCLNSKRQQHYNILTQEPISLDQHLLSFEVCGGITNQRIAIVYAIMLANWTNRTLILPRLTIDGTQSPFAGYRENRTAFDFDNIYDVEHMATALKGTVEFVMEEAPLQYCIKSNAKKHPKRCYTQWDQQLRSKGGSIFSMGCAFFSVDISDHMEMFWKIEETLMFSKEIRALGNSIIKRMVPSAKTIIVGKTYPFTALHARVEPDWSPHCTKMGEMNIYHWNCDRNSKVIHNTLYLESVPTHNLFVAGGVLSAEYKEKFASNGYEKITTKSSLGISRTIYMKSRGREFSAAVDWYVCSFSNRFIGNSWSTFTALLLLARRERGLHEKDFHYNGGHIPLKAMIKPRESVVRSTPFKWVGTVGSLASDGIRYHLSSVMTSILTRTSMQPVLIFLDSCDSDTKSHLEAIGCKVIVWSPEWRDGVGAIRRQSKVNPLPLLSNADRFISSFLRLDIPLVGLMDTHVLYSDIDVVFFADFPPHILNQPALLSCGPEDVKTRSLPCNTGVMVVNVEGLLSEHKLLFKGIMQNTEGGTWSGNPVDQGAVNYYLQPKLSQLDHNYNWKPYWDLGLQDSPKLVHFHGPKLDHYIRLLKCELMLSRNASVPEVFQCLKLTGDERIYGALVIRCWENIKSCKCSLHNSNILHGSNITALPKRLYSNALDVSNKLGQYVSINDCLIDTLHTLA